MIGGDGAKMSLVGGAASDDSILLTEVVEYALSLTPAVKGQEPFIGFPHLQPYRLVHALHLLDEGQVAQARKYTEAIASTLKLATKANPFYTPSLVAQVKEVSDRLNGTPQDQSGAWIGRKVQRPTLDAVWSGLETRFVKFVAGDSDAPQPAQPPKAEPQGTIGPFSHYSSITPAATSGTISRVQSYTDLGNAQPIARPASAAALLRTTPSAGPSPQVATTPLPAEATVTSNTPAPKLAPAPQLAPPPPPEPQRQPSPQPSSWHVPTPDATPVSMPTTGSPSREQQTGPPPVRRAPFKGHHARSSSLGFAGYNYDPYAPSPWSTFAEESKKPLQLAEENEAEETPRPNRPASADGKMVDRDGDEVWWAGDDESERRPPPTFQTVEESFSEDASGFISTMGVSASPSMPMGFAPAPQQQGHKRGQTLEEINALGLGNSKSRKPTFDVIDEKEDEEPSPAKPSPSPSAGNAQAQQPEKPGEYAVRVVWG